MTRKCRIIHSSSIYNRHLCIDIEIEKELTELLINNEKYARKFRYLAGRILEQSNMYYDNYQLLERDGSTKITEMRFFPNGDNCRVYCKEQIIDGKWHCIIMARLLLKKKSQSINKSIKPLLETIKEYEYEFETDPS